MRDQKKSQYKVAPRRSLPPEYQSGERVYYKPVELLHLSEFKQTTIFKSKGGTGRQKKTVTATTAVRTRKVQPSKSFMKIKSEDASSLLPSHLQTSVGDLLKDKPYVYVKTVDVKNPASGGRRKKPKPSNEVIEKAIESGKITRNVSTGELEDVVPGYTEKITVWKTDANGKQVYVSRNVTQRQRDSFYSPTRRKGVFVETIDAPSGGLVMKRRLSSEKPATERYKHITKITGYADFLDSQGKKHREYFSGTGWGHYGVPGQTKDEVAAKYAIGSFYKKINERLGVKGEAVYDQPVIGGTLASFGVMSAPSIVYEYMESVEVPAYENEEVEGVQDEQG